MARPPASPEERQRQRRRIQRAAGDLHAEGGVLSITARAVAKRAGVSTGTIYSYFSSLQELMRSLWREPVSVVERQLEAVARSHADPVARLHALLETYATFAFERPDVYRGALMYVRPESLPKPEAQPLFDLTFPRLLRAALEEGQEQGAIRDGDVDEMAQLLWAALHGAIALPANAELYALAPPEELAPAMIRTLLDAFTTEVQASGGSASARSGR